MQARTVIPDTFILIDRTSVRGSRESEPMLTISASNGIKGARLLLSAPLLRGVGFDPAGSAKLFCQIFLSSNTIKLVGCSREQKGARLVTTAGYVSASELSSVLHLPEKSRIRCKAEVVKNKGWEIWATLPQELREHIERLNGVVR